jgi:polyketide synthase PksM
MLVPIRTSGDGPTSFWVHSLLGEISWVMRLAHYLGERFPVYAFQTPAGAASPARFTTMEQMAAAYVSALRTVQPNGPYTLGGYSLGGAIAFEMAQQLQAAGESVSSLVLIDSYAPGSGATRSFTELSWDGFMVLMLTNTLVAQWKGGEPLRREMLPARDPEGQFQVAARHLRATTSVPQSHEELQAMLRRSLESSLANATLFERYQARPFPGKLDTLLFRNTQGFVSESNTLGIPAVQIDEADDDHGWSRWLPQAPRILHIDSDHFSLGQEPAITQIAQEIAATLISPRSRPHREDIFAVVKEQVLRVLDGVSPHSVTPETSLRELGANSIDRVEVAIFSMERLNLDVPRAAFSNVHDLRGLVDLFQAHTT